MTDPKRWPNNAEWARQDSIALAENALDELRDILHKTESLSSMGIVLRTARAMDHLQEIIRKLQEVGPR